MIDDCIQLNVEARVLRACISDRGTGVVLAKYRGRWVVWRVFRAKKAILWNCADGQYTRSRGQADSWFVEAVDKVLPNVACPECGYYYDDPDEGCDACLHKKFRIPLNMAVGK